MFAAIMPDVCTHMLYRAAETVRERTVLEFREFQPTWIGWAKAISAGENGWVWERLVWLGETYHLGSRVELSL